MILLLPFEERSHLQKIAEHLKFVSLTLNVVYWSREEDTKDPIQNTQETRWRVVKIKYRFREHSKDIGYRFILVSMWSVAHGFTNPDLRSMFTPVQHFNYHIIDVIQTFSEVITIYITDVKQLYIRRKFEIFCEHDRREGSLRFKNLRGM